MRTNICYLLFVSATLLTIAHGRALVTTKETDHSGVSISLPTLQTTERAATGKRAIIKFAAYGAKVTLFVNGKREATAQASPQTIETRLRKNDVVAFEGEAIGNSKKAGLLATITTPSKTYRTGVQDFTTKVDFPKWKKWEKQKWNAVKVFKDKETGKKLKFCHWKKARKVRIRKRFDKTASYIWRLVGAEKKPAQTALVRFVVGGENCGGKSGKKDDDDKDEDKEKDDGDRDDKGKGDDDKGDEDKDDDDTGDGNKDDEGGDDGDDGGNRVPVPKEHLSGQNDDKNDGFCVCKFTDHRGGDCYDMEDPGARSGRCKPRVCEPKFECVAAGDKMCVKRHGRSKVIMVSPNNCEVVTADDVDVLLPYEG